MKEMRMSEKSSTPARRRTLLAGAGTLGALGAAAALLPKSAAPPPADTARAADAETATSATPGYQLTDHVKHYYRTTRV
jgi:ferric-dicitrate binding protein FerR (iron transport regulator)